MAKSQINNHSEKMTIMASHGRPQMHRFFLAAGGVVLVVAVVAGIVLHSRVSATSRLNQALQAADANQPTKQLANLHKIRVSSLSQSQQAEYYSLQGQAYQNQNQVAQAIVAYEKSFSLDPSSMTTAETIAQEAQLIGDNKTAAIYYQKSIDLLTAYIHGHPAFNGKQDLDFLNTQLAQVK